MLNIKKIVVAFALLLPLANPAVAANCRGAIGYLLTWDKLLENQAKKLEEFRSSIKADDPGQTATIIKSLPRNTPAKLKDGLEEILDILKPENREKFFLLMQKLETMVLIAAMEDGKMNTLEGYDQAKNGDVLRAALEKVLANLEKKHGFKTAIDLEDKIYEPNEWLEMLSGGSLFNDTTFKDEDRKGSEHGFLTHRLQWAILMLHFDSKFKDLKMVDFFKYFGEAQKDDSWNDIFDQKELDLYFRVQPTETDATYLWSTMFDSFVQNWRSPEYTRERHTLFPGLGSWY